MLHGEVARDEPGQLRGAAKRRAVEKYAKADA